MWKLLQVLYPDNNHSDFHSYQSSVYRNTVSSAGRLLSSKVDNQSSIKAPDRLTDVSAVSTRPTSPSTQHPATNNAPIYKPLQSSGPPGGQGNISTIALFYNIYIPLDDEDDIENAKRIVREQLGQISAANLILHSSSPVILYYNTIGNPSVITDSFMADICTDFACVHLKHYSEGFEDLTLTEMHNYCHQHADATVICLHSKGSFHNHPDNSNEYWRRYMTTAVTSPDCLHGVQETSCNVCGLYFFPVWSTFFPGNIYTARCSYVKQLLPPNNYSQAMNDVYIAVMGTNTTRPRVRLNSWLYGTKGEGRFGHGRYSSEHWIGSHPSLVPCDMSAEQRYIYWMKDHKSVSKGLGWSMAPRRDFWSASWFLIRQYRMHAMKDDQSRRLQEYFLLPGHLYRWMKLYKELPPADSWFWTWYPDGEEWKRLRRAPWQEQSPSKVLYAFANMILAQSSNATKARG
jgi:hypothetical protein